MQNIDKSAFKDLNWDGMRAVIDRFGRQRVLVVGDVILDEFLWGDAARISPEAPVPVVDIHQESLRLGGAANVVNNLIALGARADLVGVVGRDYNAQRLEELLAESGVSARGLVRDGDRPTSLKTRVLARHQQVVRFDRETKKLLSQQVRAKLVAKLERIAKTSAAMIVSDYGKGVIDKPVANALRRLHREHKFYCSVDPVPAAFGLYRGFDLVTPNTKEAGEAAGRPIRSRADVLKAGRELLATHRLGGILITRGEEGMSLLEPNRDPVHVPTLAREVYDVTGAGDTVIATFTLARAAGAGPREAALLSNLAAGLVVAIPGTATAGAEELRGALDLLQSRMESR